MPLFATYSWLKQDNKPLGNSLDKTVAILMFPGVEVIDFAGPYEVFWAAGANVITVAESPDILKSGTSLKITPDYTFDNMPHADIIVLPGGNVDDGNANILKWLKAQNSQAEKIMSVCNGAFFLSSAGMLDGLTATTFFSAIPSLRTVSPRTKVVDDQRYVNNGHIVTSAGLSSGIDAALFVVSEYLGVGRTQQIATTLEYKWNNDNGFVRGQLADKHLVRVLDVFYAFPRKTLLYTGDTKNWKISLQIEANLTNDQIMELIGVQLTRVNQWKLITSKPTLSEWEFTYEEENWKGEVRIDAETSSGSRKQVSFTIERVES